MTKKDYVKLAAAFKSVEPSDPLAIPRAMQLVNAARFAQWMECVKAVADVLASDNPRFDAGIFIAACHRPHSKDVC